MKKFLFKAEHIIEAKDREKAEEKLSWIQGHVWQIEEVKGGEQSERSRKII